MTSRSVSVTVVTTAGLGLALVSASLLVATPATAVLAVSPSAPVASAAAGAARTPGSGTTREPKGSTTRVGMSVAPDGTELRKVGVGYPLTVSFGSRVKRKGAVERQLVVTVDGKPIAGAWSWLSGSTVMYRPRHGFWPANSKITVHATLAGTVLARNGKQKRKLVVANRKATRNVTYRTARAFVAHINDAKHRMVVRKNGKKLRTIPVSMGMPGFRTRSGIKVATDKYVVKRMVNQGLGYDVMSPYAVRITPTGEFIHGAPWAYGRIGRWDGSHGCVNLFVDDAKWYYDHVMLGDPVVTKGTGRPMEWDNGLGGPWNIPWRVWLKNSALGVRS
jgi:lipoprotein-anchoring transpeptidase ErfK/SrfK